MTGEIITMIGVGIALVAFNWRVLVRVESRLDGRINGLEKEVHGLAREVLGLRKEIQGSRQRPAESS